MSTRIHVVLHRPIYPRNIGMCARAMGNMGASRLIIVAPQTELTDEAKQGAAHAQSYLREATIYKDLADFHANEGGGIRIALSGRDNRLKEPELLEDVVSRAVGEKDHPIHDTTIPIYLMFGAEDDGMTNEEMELCHHICRLPTFGEIVSLNISHAVQLTLYIVRRALRDSGISAGGESKNPLPLKEEPLYYPQETIRKWLEALGFDLSARRVNIERTLNRILLSRTPTGDELRVVDSVLQQTVRKLSASKKPNGEE